MSGDILFGVEGETPKWNSSTIMGLIPFVKVRGSRHLEIYGAFYGISDLVCECGQSLILSTKLYLMASICRGATAKAFYDFLHAFMRGDALSNFKRNFPLVVERDRLLALMCLRWLDGSGRITEYREEYDPDGMLTALFALDEVINSRSDVCVDVPLTATLEELCAVREFTISPLVWKDVGIEKRALRIQSVHLYSMIQMLNSFFGVAKRNLWEIVRESETEQSYFLICDAGYLRAVQLIMVETLLHAGAQLDGGAFYQSYAQVFAASMDERFSCVRGPAIQLFVQWLGVEINSDMMPPEIEMQMLVSLLYRTSTIDMLKVFIRDSKRELARAIVAFLAPFELQRVLKSSAKRAVDRIVSEGALKLSNPELLNKFVLFQFHFGTGLNEVVLPGGELLIGLYKLLVSNIVDDDTARTLFLAIRLDRVHETRFCCDYTIPASANFARSEPIEAITAWKASLPQSGPPIERPCRSDLDRANFFLMMCFAAEKESCERRFRPVEPDVYPSLTASEILAWPECHFKIPVSERYLNRADMLPMPTSGREDYKDYYHCVLAKRLYCFKTLSPIVCEDGDVGEEEILKEEERLLPHFGSDAVDLVKRGQYESRFDPTDFNNATTDFRRS